LFSKYQVEPGVSDLRVTILLEEPAIVRVLLAAQESLPKEPSVVAGKVRLPD